MSALIFTLKETPPQRLDLAPLVPHVLAGKSEKQIAAIVVSTNRERLRVADLFRVRMGDANNIRFAGGSERFDNLGYGMNGGTIAVKGDAGICAGRLMQGGRLTIEGSAGHWAASGLKDGLVSIAGDCGDFVGGPLAGEMAGMRGGMVNVAGNAGQRAGDRMRRGMITIAGRAGAFAGSRMIAGTLIISGRAGPLPGYLMRRGTIIIGRGAQAYSPTFIDSGTGELNFLKLLARDLEGMGLAPAALKRRRYMRLGGDTAVMGKGEIFAG